MKNYKFAVATVMAAAMIAFSRPNWTLSPRQTGQPVHAKLIG